MTGFTINNLACASCHAWLDQDQIQIHQCNLLTQRQMSSCHIVSSTAVTFVYRNAVQWGLLVIKFKMAPVFCFCPLWMHSHYHNFLSDNWQKEKTEKKVPFKPKWGKTLHNTLCIWWQRTAGQENRVWWNASDSLFEEWLLLARNTVNAGTV